LFAIPAVTPCAGGDFLEIELKETQIIDYLLAAAFSIR
jgi:hypothetical protein